MTENNSSNSTTIKVALGFYGLITAPDLNEEVETKIKVHSFSQLKVDDKGKKTKRREMFVRVPRGSLS